jgi:hypothetical protein
MATPKMVFKKIVTSQNQQKIFEKKTVVQNITISYYSTGSTSIILEIYRTLSADYANDAYQTQHFVKKLEVLPNATNVLENLRWVFEEGDVLAFKSSSTGLLIYVDGVEFD